MPSSKRLFFAASLIFALCLFSLPAQAEISDASDYQISLQLNLGPLITLPSVGHSAFLRVEMLLPDGRRLDVTKDSDYYENDRSVCLANGGRLLATGRGETLIHVAYEGTQQSVRVRVLSSEEPWFPALLCFQEQQKSRPLSTVQGDILERAFTMLNLQWSPLQDLDGWDQFRQYKAGGVYRGLPYSQCSAQNSAAYFLAALGGGAAYQISRSPRGIVQSAAGNDCSGFVSRAWDIERLTTWGFDQAVDIGRFSKLGSWDNFPHPKQNALLASYPMMTAGDALLTTAGGHITLVFANDPEARLVYCFEQTPPSARLTVWTYRQLANGFFKPIRR